jgi:hypothetical protein
MLHSPHERGEKLHSPGKTRADEDGFFAAESLLGGKLRQRSKSF